MSLGSFCTRRLPHPLLCALQKSYRRRCLHGLLSHSCLLANPAAPDLQLAVMGSEREPGCIVLRCLGSDSNATRGCLRVQLGKVVRPTATSRCDLIAATLKLRVWGLGGPRFHPCFAHTSRDWEAPCRCLFSRRFHGPQNLK